MKNSLIVILCFLVSSNAYSQIKEIKLGMKLGANYQYDQQLEDARVYEGKLLFHGGIVSEFIIGIKKKFSLQTELLYSAQGFSETYYYNPVYQQHQFKDEIFINYFNLPLLAKYKINEHFIVESGLYLSYMLFKSNNWELLKGDAAFHSENKYSIWNKDFGFIFGIDYQLNKFLNFSIRYNYGFINIVEFADYNTQMLQMSIAYTPKIWVK